MSGYIRMKILSFILYPNFPVNINDYIVRFDLNKQTTDVSRFEDAGYLYFENLGMGDNLQLYVSDPKGMSPEVGMAEVRLTQLLRYPQSLQKITVHLSAKDRVKGWAERDAGIMTLEFLYTTQQFRGKLDLTIVDANLVRDTEVVGKMDPYTIVKFRTGQVKTKVLNNKGKNPDWNQTLSMNIASPNEPLDIRVMDKDVLKDDQVGRIVISPREAGFLSANQGIRTFELKHKDRTAGTIRIIGKFNMV